MEPCTKALLHTTKTCFEALTHLPLPDIPINIASQNNLSLSSVSLVFQPSTSSDILHLFSLRLSVALEPNYQSRTQRSYHSGHASLFTMLSAQSCKIPNIPGTASMELMKHWPTHLCSGVKSKFMCNVWLSEVFT